MKIALLKRNGTKVEVKVVAVDFMRNYVRRVKLNKIKPSQAHLSLPCIILTTLGLENTSPNTLIFPLSAIVSMTKSFSLVDSCVCWCVEVIGNG